MKFYIIAVGKIKNKGYSLEVSNYLKQIPYKVEVIEIKDEPTISGLNIEKTKILKKIPKNSYIISLAIEGKEHDSISFSKHLLKLIETGKKNIVFIIGGSYGLHEEIIKSSNELLSFSQFTFPHQLMRVILAEQLFRAFKIMDNHPYHK